MHFHISLFIALSCLGGAALADGAHQTAPPPRQHGEPPPEYKAVPYAEFQKEIAEIRNGLKVSPTDNCHIPHPLTEEELITFGYNPPKSMGGPKLPNITQYRMLTGLRSIAKFIKENKIDLKGVKSLCIGAEAAGPTLNGQLVVPWNANEHQLKQLFAGLPTEEELKAMGKKVADKEKDIARKHGISVQNGGRFISMPGAPYNKVLPLLDAIDRAMTKREVAGKRIDGIFLEMNPNSKKMGFLIDSPGSGLGDKRDHGFVSINARIVEPAEIEALLSSDAIPPMPTDETFAQLQQAATRVTDPLLRQRLKEVEAEMHNYGTGIRRERMKTAMAAMDRHGWTSLMGGKEQPREELPLLRLIAEMPAGSLRPGADRVKPIYMLPYGGEPSLNRWIHWGGKSPYDGSYGAVVMGLDATPEQLREAIASVPKQADLERTLELSKKNAERAIAVMRKNNIQLSLFNVQQMTYQNLQDQARVLGVIADKFEGVRDNGTTKTGTIMFQPKANPEGKKVWYMAEYNGTLAVSVDATEADLRDFMVRSGMPK